MHMIGVCLHIPTNLSKTKSGTKSLNFWSRSGTFSKLSSKLAYIIKFRGKIVCKNAEKKWDKVKKKWDSRKFSNKKWDCPT